jgi:hypothetical protein
MSLDVEELLHALDNENNTGVAGLTASKRGIKRLS